MPFCWFCHEAAHLSLKTWKMEIIEASSIKTRSFAAFIIEALHKIVLETKNQEIFKMCSY